MLPFVLLPIEVNAITQERCCKGNAIGAFGSGGGKMVLTLLAEVIASHMGLTTIDVRWSSLQWLLMGVVRGGAWASRTILRIFCRFFSVYLATEGSARGLTRLSSWLDSEKNKDPDGPSEVYSRQGRPRPRIEVILVVGVERSGMGWILNNAIQTSWLTRWVWSN